MYESLMRMRPRKAQTCLLLLPVTWALLAANPESSVFRVVSCGFVDQLPQQQAAQNPSPMIEHTRPHPRIPQTEANGRRADLKSLKGARIFVSPRVDPHQPVPLIVHFHGAP